MRRVAPCGMMHFAEVKCYNPVEYSSLWITLWPGKKLSSRFQRVQSYVPRLVNLGWFELNISSPHSVPEVEPSVTSMKPSVMEIVKLRWKHNWKMVAWVIILHLEVEPTVPDPLDRNGRRCEKEPEPRPNGPSQKVLDGMRIQGCRSDGKYPLMVFLVNVLVDGLVMKKHMAVVKEKVVSQDSGQHMPKKVPNCCHSIHVMVTKIFIPWWPCQTKSYLRQGHIHGDRN